MLKILITSLLFGLLFLEMLKKCIMKKMKKVFTEIRNLFLRTHQQILTKNMKLLVLMEK